MKYMLMMNAPRGSGDYQITAWKPEEIKAHMAFMHELNAELIRAGEFVTAEGLSTPGEAKLVRAGKNGAPPVTDGVFPESKEFLAGFWIVDVDRPERAYAIAARASAAPWPAEGIPDNPRGWLFQISIRRLTDQLRSELARRRRRRSRSPSAPWVA